MVTFINIIIALITAKFKNTSKEKVLTLCVCVCNVYTKRSYSGEISVLEKMFNDY